MEANAAGAGLLGTSRAGLAQRPFTSFILPDDQDVFYLHCRLMFDTGEKRACELRIWRGDGSVIWIQMESSPSMDWKGCPQVLAVISDISGRKDAEAALEAIQADLEYRVMERGKELRRMALSLAMAEERERHLIAHDLHDGIEQMIHVIRLRVESLPRLGLVPEGIVAVEDLVRNLLEASRMLRSIGSRLSPPVLEKLGLAPAFSWLADFMEQDYGLHVHVESRSPPEALPHELSFILFRSVRELLINVSKHAEVREAWLSIEAVEGYLELVVEDHGRGIAAQSAQSPADARFGIRSIRDRMLQLGGRLEIDSMPGRGSRMAITVPLSPDVPDKEPRP